MFTVGHGRNRHDNGIDDPPFLYSEHHRLLEETMLIPEPDFMCKARGSKADIHAFGLLDNLGIYKQYNDSGSSSMHQGERNGSSDYEGSHLTPGDDLSMTASTFNGMNGSAYTASQSPIPISNNIRPTNNHQNLHLIGNMKGKSAFHVPLSPIQQQLLEASPQLDGEGVYVSLKRKRGSSTPEDVRTARLRRDGMDTPPNFSAKMAKMEFRARSSIPQHLSWMEFGRQGILAAYSSRLNPYAFHPEEYRLLRGHITKSQVTIYLNIRNAILRLWHRNPLVGVTRHEAAGCSRDSRYFDLSQFAYDWLLRNGYINFGCVDLPNTAGSIPRAKAKGGRRKTIVVIGAGMSGLGCARQLESLIAQYGTQFTENGERPPKVIVLEGRNRIGGRVYSHPLKIQEADTLPNGLRNTAEMGAHIITGFEHGNPLNAIVRGQLGLRYHALKDDSVLYDVDGKIVEKKRDTMLQDLYNDILDRAAAFRTKVPTEQTVEGDKSLLYIGEDPRDSYHDPGPVLSSMEDAGMSVTVTDGNPLDANTISKAYSFSGVEKVAGRQYQLAGSSNNSTAVDTAKRIGFQTKSDISASYTINLDAITTASHYPTLGEAIDEGIRQYQHILGLTAQDLRLLNWHQANLEYANATIVDELSLGGWDQDGGNEFEGEHTQVIGGYTQVPRGLWQVPTKLDVRFQSAVTTIRSQENDPTSAPVIVECSSGEVFEADRVVVTTPLGVLKSNFIKFTPPLPEWKTSCIERMGFGLLNKVILVYDKPFWEEDRDMFGFLNDPVNNNLDQNSYKPCRGRFYFFWNCIKTSGRPVLVALMAGAAAHSVEKTDNNTLVEEVTGRLSMAFAPKKVPPPTEVIVTRWRKDPFARGSYSYVGPRTQQGDYNAMAKPVGRIHFAGEATCGTHPATVHGAYISGLRAASEVIENLLGPIRIPDPLIPRKVKAEVPTPPVFATPNGTKNKKGYVDVWEPILPPPAPTTNDKVNAEAEAYEAKVIFAILKELGARPVKPDRMGVNPYLMYTKDEWYKMKSKCDAEKAATTGNPNAKAGRDEIRVALGHAWRTASEEIKRPYIEQCENARKGNTDYNEKVKLWDAKAARIRKEFIEKNPPPDGARGSFQGPSAIEFGSGRKGRKLSGYEE